MILRSWHGIVPIESGDAFERNFRDVTINEIEAVPGNFGVLSRFVRQDDYVHVFLLSYWEDWEAIRRFAGDAPHIAVTYPDDAQYGLISDPLVLHHECSVIQSWFGEREDK
jgi:heme-degrading monooxygenase HmoA